MQVIYEATDAMIYYGVENEDKSALAWATQFGFGPASGHGGLAREYFSPSARRESGRVGAYALIEFYGSACMVLGSISGVTLTALVDDNDVPLKMPYNDSIIATIDKLTVEWHILSLQIAAVNKTTDGSEGTPPGPEPLEGITGPTPTDIVGQGDAVPVGLPMIASPGTVALDRVLIDTGLPDNLNNVVVYHADEDIWNLSGNWTKGLLDRENATQSLETINQGDSVSLRAVLPRQGLLFLYGNVGRSHGLFQVAWGNGDTIDLTTFPPRTTFNGESDSELSNVLLFAGVAPEGGWDNLYFTHTDDRDARKLEFTRLEVYTTNQEHESASSTSFGSAGPSGPSSSGRSTSASTSNLPPGIIRGVVAGGVVSLILVIFVIALLIRRRRRASSSLHPFAPSPLSQSLSIPLTSAVQLSEDSGSPPKHLLATYRASKRIADTAAASSNRSTENGRERTAAGDAGSQEREYARRPAGLDTAPPAYSESLTR